jgi:hypothetical protein
MIRIGSILVEVILTGGVCPVGDVAAVIKDEDRNRKSHQVVGGHFKAWKG